MSRQEIIDLINNNKASKKTMLSLNDLSDLKKVAYVFLGIDDTYEYVYKVKIDELVDKEFRKELLTDYGWILSKDESLILLYF